MSLVDQSATNQSTDSSSLLTSYHDHHYHDHSFNLSGQLQNQSWWNNRSSSDDHEYYSTSYKVVGTLVTGLIFAVGCIGNVMVVIVVLRSKSMRSPTNCYLVSLALADLLLLLSATLPTIAEYYLIVDEFAFGSVACSVMVFFQYFGFNLSSLSITALTTERYIAICRPMKAQSLCTVGRAKKIIAIIWLFGFCYSAPWLGLTTTRLKAGSTTVEQCTFTLERRQYLAYYLADLVVMYLIPVIVNACLYALIANTLYRSNPMASAFGGGPFEVVATGNTSKSISQSSKTIQKLSESGSSKSSQCAANDTKGRSREKLLKKHLQLGRGRDRVEILPHVVMENRTTFSSALANLKQTFTKTRQNIFRQANSSEKSSHDKLSSVEVIDVHIPCPNSSRRVNISESKVTSTNRSPSLQQTVKTCETQTNSEKQATSNFFECEGISSLSKSADKSRIEPHLQSLRDPQEVDESWSAETFVKKLKGFENFKDANVSLKLTEESGERNGKSGCAHVKHYDDGDDFLPSSLPSFLPSISSSSSLPQNFLSSLSLPTTHATVTTHTLPTMPALMAANSNPQTSPAGAQNDELIIKLKKSYSSTITTFVSTTIKYETTSFSTTTKSTTTTTTTISSLAGRLTATLPILTTPLGKPPTAPQLSPTTKQLQTTRQTSDHEEEQTETERTNKQNESYHPISIGKHLNLVASTLLSCEKSKVSLSFTSSAGSAYNSAISSRMQIIKMLVVVVGLFAVLWLPYRLYVVYNSFLENRFEDIWLMLLCRTMVYTNSAINPILYNAMSVKFKKAFKKLWSCGRIRPKPFAQVRCRRNVQVYQQMGLLRKTCQQRNKNKEQRPDRIVELVSEEL